MAGLKKLTTRIINKHATAAVWNGTNFTPLQGEIVVYDPGYDSKDGKTYTRERMKIGDGSHTIQELPFAHEVEAVVTKDIQSINVVTSVGTPSYTSSEYVAPSMSHELDETTDTLSVTFDAGSYKAAEFKAGETASTSTISYVSTVDVAVQMPTD